MYNTTSISCDVIVDLLVGISRLPVMATGRLVSVTEFIALFVFSLSSNLHFIKLIKVKVKVKIIFIYIADRKGTACSCRFFSSACFQLRSTTTCTLLLIRRPRRTDGLKFISANIAI